MTTEDIAQQGTPELDDVQLETSNADELTLGDLGGNFIKNPEVGDEVTFTIARVVKNTKNLEPINPKTKQRMKVALSNVDYNIQVATTDGRQYTISAWEVWGKLKAIWKKLAGDRKDFLMANQVVRVKHLLDGMRAENKDKNCYEVAVQRDGQFFVLDRQSNEWQTPA